MDQSTSSPISSLSAFIANSKRDAFNGGATFGAYVNPNGLNGQFQNQTGPGNFAIYDKVSRGLEIMFTAEPRAHWRAASLSRRLRA